MVYFQTVQPCISSNKVLEAYFLVLCSASITEAFYFSRTQSDLKHRILFEKLISFVHSKSVGEVKAARAVELISLPLNEHEEAWFTEFLGRGKGSMLSGAADTLIMRGLAIERSDSNAQRQRERRSEKVDGVNWETLRSNI